MPHKHITRLDYQKTHGWWVRIRRRSNPCSKLFSDGVCGGSHQALESATIWRDEQLAKAPKLTARGKESSSKKIKTGVPGLSVSFVDGASGTMVHLQVSISRKGKRTSTRYSVTKWGLRAALWKSCVSLVQGSADGAINGHRAIELFEESYPKVASALEEVGNVFEKTFDVE